MEDSSLVSENSENVQQEEIRKKTMFINNVVNNGLTINNFFFNERTEENRNECLIIEYAAAAWNFFKRIFC